MFRKRITLIDTDESFCTAVSAILKNSERFQINKVYHNNVEALKRLRDDLSEIIIMDLDFPELRGTDFILKARERVPGIDILVITNYSDEQIVFHTLAQGASGYLLKRKCLPQLTEALTAMENGGSPLDPMVSRYLIRSMHINEVSPLSIRESTVLKLLAQGKTHTAIASELFIANETVKTHLKNIYRKLKVNTKAGAIRKAFEERLVVGHLGYSYQ